MKRMTHFHRHADPAPGLPAPPAPEKFHPIKLNKINMLNFRMFALCEKFGKFQNRPAPLIPALLIEVPA